MRINNDKATYIQPFSVVLLDAMDAYYYADVMDKMEEVTKVETYEKAVAIADALFVVKNHGWESLQAMNDVDGGYDVRVYDSTMSCVYAAHAKYIDKWIGEEESSSMTPVDHEKTYQEFKKRFSAMSDEELIGAFNREVGNPGWTSSRATYLSLLREEFEKRGYDYSAVGGNGGLSLKNKVELVGGKTVVIDEFNTMLNAVVKDIPGAKLITTKKYHRTLLATGEKDTKDETKPFKVYCDDMFHYQDTDARLFIGLFATGDEAKEKCRAILMETLLSHYEPGMTAETLMTKWWTFGDDPWISDPNPSPDDITFSAAKEAPAFAKHIVEQKEQELTANN
ncbi:MAG: hypothetical protein Q7R89_00390 [bacterium]|nr:hypothetical protein [bacterium]